MNVQRSHLGQPASLTPTRLTNHHIVHPSNLAFPSSSNSFQYSYMVLVFNMAHFPHLHQRKKRIITEAQNHRSTSLVHENELHMNPITKV